MPHRKLPALLLLLLLGVTLAIPALAQGVEKPADLASTVKLLSDTSGDVREQAARDIVAFGTAAIDPLFAVYDMSEGGPTVAAQHALESLCYAATGTSDASAVADALLAQVAARKRPMVRQFAMRWLALTAGPAQVPAVAKLARDRDLFDMAVYVLTQVPGHEATVALSDLVLAELQAPSEAKTIAAVTALAQRHDPEGVPAVREALGSDSPAVRYAAIQALGAIPSKDCVGPLRELMSGECPLAKAAATVAFVGLAERLRTSGHRVAAKDLFLEAYGDGYGDERVVCAALRGLSAIGGPGVLPVLVRSLGSTSPAVRGVAREGLAKLDGPTVTSTVAEAMAGQSSDFRIAALGVLGCRGGDAALPAVLEAAVDPDEAVRLAAYAALATAKARAGAETLVAAATTETGAARDAALFALSRVGGPEAVSAILEALGREGLEASLQVTLLRSLGTRGDSKATPALLAATASPEADVRKAGLAALGALHDPGAIAPLLECLAKLPPDDAPAAVDAIAKVPAATGKPILLASLDKSAPTAQAIILGVLGGYKDRTLAGLFRTWADKPEAPVAAAAITALAGVAGDSALSELSAFSSDGRPEVRAAALQGLLASAEARDPQDQKALAAYQDALGKAQGDAEKSRALSGIARIPDATSLPLLEPLLANPGGAGQALASALTAVATKVSATDKQKAVDLLQKAIGFATDPALLRQVATTLRDLGVEVDVAKAGGFVTGWWVTPPVGSRDDLTKSDVLDPTKPVDVSQPVNGAKWKFWFVDDPRGLLDLEVTSQRADNVGAYVYAEVESPSDQDIELKMGSDDGLVVWVNGAEVHRFTGDRAWSLDSDTVKAHLVKGWNRILCKVLQGGAQWSCSVRLVTTDGKPLVLPQARPKVLKPEDAGFITNWWTAGPWGTRERMRTVDALDTSLPVDVGRGVSYGGRTNPWVFHHLDVENGLLNLREAVASQDDAGCYAYARVESDAERDVVLRIGSDDDLVVWVNGAQVLKVTSVRACQVDQDAVKVRLTKGANTILCKVLQEAGEWSLVVRVTDEAGQPIVLPQARP